MDMQTVQPYDRRIPVVLFIYSRTVHLRSVLECLRAEKIPLLYIFADGAKNDLMSADIHASRECVKAIDWCEVRLIERIHNLGLGKNILMGVTEVAALYDQFIVWEDDLVCAPGTYLWICNALTAYANNPKVMSVTAWTHPSIRPPDVMDVPYFDGRAECWVWGSYSRSWQGMDQTALEKVDICANRGISPDAYGYDLLPMAQMELQKNIWAVRWLYHHIQHSGLCLRPSRSMVEHIGCDVTATNASAATEWANDGLAIPMMPENWPDPVENSHCQALWRKATIPYTCSLVKRAYRRLKWIVYQKRLAR